MILAETGRIRLKEDPLIWIRQAVKDSRFREAPMTHDVAIASRSVNLPHQDPADRFLVATALVYDLVLVTADRALLQARPCQLLPAI